MKSGTFIKHDRNMDVCYRIVKALKSTDTWHMKVKIYNMGFARSWYIDTMIIRIPFDNVSEWKQLWKPNICLRKAAWIRILK